MSVTKVSIRGNNITHLHQTTFSSFNLLINRGVLPFPPPPPPPEGGNAKVMGKKKTLEMRGERMGKRKKGKRERKGKEKEGGKKKKGKIKKEGKGKRRGKDKEGRKKGGNIRKGKGETQDRETGKNEKRCKSGEKN